MKHTLSFEPTWKKALSKQDQQLIERLFEKAVLPKEGEIGFVPIRAAYNHRGDLIASALLQNSQNSFFSPNELQLIYKENGKKIAEHLFTIPRLVVPPYTTIPWSFLFPEEAQSKKAALTGWEITAAFITNQ